jgi:hypothetical protein
VGKTDNSVADALLRAHGALLADLRKLEEAIRPSSGESPKELLVRLGATRTHILEHFRFEEQNGYLDAVRQREPRLERIIQQLAEEHRQLTQALDTLLGEAQAAVNLGESLRQDIRAWVESVRRHEARENDLVQDAFNLDIGAED